MSELDLLWSYQIADLAVDQAERKLRSLPERQALLKTRNFIVEQQDVVKGWEDDAPKVSDRIEKLKAYYSTVTDKLQAQMEELDDIEEYAEGDLTSLRNDVQQSINQLNRIEKELNQIVGNMANQQKRWAQIRGDLNKARKEYPELKDRYDRASVTINGEIIEKRKVRDQAGESVSEPLLNKYKRIKQVRTPVLVHVLGEQCGGCNMQLASVVLRNVVSGENVVECENCGRIFYNRK